MTRVLAAVAALVLVVVLVIERNHARDAAKAEPPTMPAAVTSSTGSAAAPPAGHIKRITSEQRHELEQKIEAARAARAERAGATAATTTAPPRLPGSREGGIENLPAGALDMLKEALPYLADCYQQGSSTPDKAIALLTLEGDPDVGTLIDPGEMRDDKDQPIDKEVASCLATTLQSLQLPPLREGDSIKLQFTFPGLQRAH